MLYVDIPDREQLRRLVETRADACVSIYLPTTPVTQDIGAARIAFGNLTRSARHQLEADGFDQRRLNQLLEEFDNLAEDNEFWRFQAHSLAVLATPDRIRTFRLANRLTEMVEVSDRFHLKPLLRAVTFPHAAVILALSENAVRAVEIAAEGEPQLLDIPGLPSDGASAVGKSTLNDRSHGRRIHGSEGQKVQLAKYVRAVSTALEGELARKGVPLILAATEPLASMFRQISSLEPLPGTISGSVDRMTDKELAEAARPILDAYYATRIREFAETFEERASSGRAVSDISDAARAATFGAIDTLLVNFDIVVNGTVDPDSGAVEFDEDGDARNYGVVDEIAARAIITGADVLAVRGDDIPAGKELAAILRYPI